MNRRQLLVGLGATAAGGGAAIGTGAFTSVSADRDVSVAVANENNAYLGIEPSPPSSPNSTFATQDASTSNQIGLNFDDSGNSGSGVGLSSTYNFDDVFRITNQGTQTIYVWANFSGGDLGDDDIWFYPDSNDDRRLNDGTNSVVTVPTGETINMGVHVDTNALESASDQTLTATLTADIEVPGSSSPADGSGEDAAVVTQNPGAEEYSSVQSAIDNVDGTTIFVEPGTYSEDVVVDTADLTLRSTQGPGSTTLSGSIEVDSAASADSPVTDVTIEGFRIEPSGDPAIEAETGGSGTTQDGLTLRNNELVAQDSEVGAFLGQIANATIEGNLFTTASGATPIELLFVGGERSYGADRPSENVTVRNNVFEGSVERPEQQSGGNAIEFEATGSITNNDFSSFSADKGYKVLLAAASDLNFSIQQNNTGLNQSEVKLLPSSNLPLDLEDQYNVLNPDGEADAGGSGLTNPYRIRPIVKNGDGERVRLESGQYSITVYEWIGSYDEAPSNAYSGVAPVNTNSAGVGSIVMGTVPESAEYEADVTYSGLPISITDGIEVTVGEAGYEVVDLVIEPFGESSA